MNINKLHAYARLTYVNGDAELFDSGGIQLTLRDVLVHLSQDGNKFKPFTIEVSPTPFPAKQLDESVRFASTQGIDPSMIMSEDELPDSLKLGLNLALMVESDEMLKEYRMMVIPSVREATMPERQQQLKRYVESKYAGTPHWDGIHRW